MVVIGAVAALAACLALLTVGHGLIALGLLFVPLLLLRGGYPLAWLGLLLSSATAVQFGPLVLADVFLAPAVVIAAAQLLTMRDRPRLPWQVVGVAVLIAGTSIVRAIIDPNLLALLYALRFALIIVGLPILFLRHSRVPGRFEGLLAAYVLGAAGNGLAAVLDARGLHIASRITGFQGAAYNGGRYPGFTYHVTQLGMVCVMAAPMLLFLARRNRAWHLAWLPLIGGILACGSRLAIVGVIAAVAFYAICERRRRVRTFVVLVGVAVGGYFAAQAFGLDVGLSRLLTGQSSALFSDQLRVQEAGDAVTQFGQSPIFGVGFQLPTAESTYLEMLRDGGIVIAVPLFAMIAWVAIQCFRTYSPAAAAPAAVLFTWLLQQIQFNGIYDRYLWVPFGAAVAVIAIRERASLVTESQMTGTDDTQPQRRAATSVAHLGAQPV